MVASKSQLQIRSVGMSAVNFKPLIVSSTRYPLLAWNATERDHPRQRCIGELVSAQAAANPQALAVVGGSLSLTYGELEARANHLAHYLLSLGVVPEMPVALFLGHSTDFVIGALGILKAGGAYLPVDPACPVERLALMMKDTGARFLVTESCRLPRISRGPWTTISVDSDAQIIARGSSASPTAEVKPSNLAYLIYTSGSTDKPKAVEITHDSLLNLMFWHQRAFGVTATDRAPFMAAVGFDAAVWELWPYLAAGASLHMPEDEAIHIIPESLRDWLVRERITICFVPTPLAEQVMTLEWPPETELRIMLTGADTLHQYPSPKLPFRVVNNYGPTECTVVATSGYMESANHQDMLPSIGTPIDNTQIYILDENLQPAPIGAPGELYIGGAGLARGYRNRPELTAEKFIPNPFSRESNARLYRTGDFGFYLGDGRIAFAGRSDDQLKIRGHRVEINEIIAVLGRHPAVQSSTVVAREAKPGENISSLMLLRPPASI